MGIVMPLATKKRQARNQPSRSSDQIGPVMARKPMATARCSVIHPHSADTRRNGRGIKTSRRILSFNGAQPGLL